MTSNPQHILDRAAERCAQTGARLTEKRKQILELLVESRTPLSAYDIVEQYKQATDQTIQPMSAYRILDFLVEEKLVHKLNLANQYIACSHIACSHEHEVSQFLICKQCKKVKEITIPSDIVDRLKESVSAAGYHFQNSQLEIDCVCEACAGTGSA